MLHERAVTYGTVTKLFFAVPTSNVREMSGSDVPDPVSLLPHRPPFRFVGLEPFLAGHFPGNPVFPGVLQLEALAQAGAIAVLSDARYVGKLPLFGGVEDARFRRIVRPGDEIVLDVELERLSARGGWGRGLASVDGQECCRARLLFAMA